MLVAVRGEVMNRLPLGARPVEIFLQIVGRESLGNTDSGSLLVDCGLIAHPHDIVGGEFVAEDYLAVIVDVYDRVEAGIGLVKEIHECGVLTIAVAVVGKVAGSFLVAEEKQDA